MNNNAIRPTMINIDLHTEERVKRLAEARHRSPHWMILEAIRQYVDREEKREALHQDCLNIWNEYQASGRHVTFEEADVWLAKLAAGEDEDMPACHG